MESATSAFGSKAKMKNGKRDCSNEIVLIARGPWLQILALGVAAACGAKVVIQLVMG